MFSVVVFGEVLFDSFADGKRLGGAPFNLAWHLKGLGDEPLFISRVGDDGDGQEVRSRMAGWGLDRSALQTDPTHPTGVVRVTLAEGQPQYDIRPEQAYDFVEAASALGALAGVAGQAPFYHGTLALRHQTSRRAWRALTELLAGRIFVDLNLRPPWQGRDLWTEILQGCRYLKLNQDELAVLAGRELPAQADLDRAAQEIMTGRDLAWVCVTQGARGAMLCRPGRAPLWAPAPAMDPKLIKDTVGAGDAFSAVLLHGLLRGWRATDLVGRAVGFSAELCRHRGALVEDPGVYQRFRREWGDDAT